MRHSSKDFRANCLQTKSRHTKVINDFKQKQILFLWEWFLCFSNSRSVPECIEDIRMPLLWMQASSMSYRIANFTRVIANHRTSSTERESGICANIYAQKLERRRWQKYFMRLENWFRCRLIKIAINGSAWRHSLAIIRRCIKFAIISNSTAVSKIVWMTILCENFKPHTRLHPCPHVRSTKFQYRVI